MDSGGANRAAEQAIAASGLFDAAWYVRSYGAYVGHDEDPIAHLDVRNELGALHESPAGRVARALLSESEPAMVIWTR